MGAGIAEDGIKKQCHVLLGPTINIQRDPRAGRYFESYSEDPVLTGELAAAWVRGCQSKDVGATMKHFVGNESETDRRFVSSNIAPDALREVYLEPFRRIMKGVAHTKGRFGGQPACVMTAYNRVNGTSSSENTTTIMDILRKDWGFTGLVISDWFALHANGLKATDLEMPGPPQFRKEEDVKAALEKGEISERDLDDRVSKLLELIVKVAPLGYRKSPSEEKEESVDPNKVARTIREIAAEGAVLVKNEGGILPVEAKSGLRIACIGRPWVEAVQSGGGSANLTPQKVTQPLESLRKALDGQDVHITHHDGCDSHKLPPKIESKTQLEYFSGRVLGQGTSLGTQSIDMVKLAPRDSKTAKLEPNNFWIQASFNISFTQEGKYRLAPICLGSMQMTSDRKDKWDYEGESNVFEYFLNPAKRYSPIIIHGQAGEEIQIKLNYLPCLLDDQMKVSLICGFQVGLEYEKDEEAEIEEAAKVAAEANIALVMTATGKDWESEGYDRTDIELPRKQNDLVLAVSKLQSQTVVLNITGSVVTLPWRDNVKGLVQCWFGGQEGGEALVDIILGRGRAPASGRMANSWPAKIQDHPSGSNLAYFPGIEKSDGLNVEYNERRLVGYKYYNSNKSGPEPALYFGSGLGGYTTFKAKIECVSGSCNSLKEKIDIKVLVKNTGKRSGKFVVQLYIRPHAKAHGQPLQKVC